MTGKNPFSDTIQILKENFSPYDFWTLQAYFSNLQVHERGIDQIGFTFLKSFYPFQDDNQVVCIEFQENSTRVNICLVLAARPFVYNGFPVHTTLGSKYNSKGKIIYYTVARGGGVARGPVLNISEIGSVLIQYIKFYQQPSSSLRFLDIPKALQESFHQFSLEINKAEQDIQEQLIPRGTEGRGIAIKAILIANPSSTGKNNPFPSDSPILSPNINQKFAQDGLTLLGEVETDIHSRSESFYQRQIVRSGFYGLQILLQSGRVISEVTSDVLSELGFKFKRNTHSGSKSKKNQDELWFTAGSFIESEENEKLEMIGYLQKQNIPIYLVNGLNIWKPRQFCPVSSVSVQTEVDKPLYRLSISGSNNEYLASNKQVQAQQVAAGFASIDFAPTGELSFDLVSNQTAFNFKEKHLLIHPWYWVLKKMEAELKLNFMSNSEQGIQNNCLVGTMGLQKFSIVQLNHEKIRGFLLKVKSMFQTVVDDSGLSCQPLVYRKIVVDTQSDRFSFGVEYSPLDPSQALAGSPSLKSACITNFSYFWEFFLQGCKYGLVGHVGPEEKDYYAGRIKAKRAANLKLLRHTGAFNLIIHSCLSHIQSADKSSQNEKSFKKELLSRIELLCRSKNPIGRTEVSFSSVYNKNLESLIINLVDGLIGALNPSAPFYLFYNGQIYNAEGLLYQQSKVVYFLLNQMLESTNGDLFLATKNKYVHFGSGHLPPDLINTRMTESIIDREELEPGDPEYDEFDDYDDDMDDEFNGRMEHLRRPPEWIVGPMLQANLSEWAALKEGQLVQSYAYGSDPLYRGEATTGSGQPPSSASTAFSWMVWPSVVAQFPEVRVMLNGKPVESIDPSLFRYEFTVANALSTNEADHALNKTINWFDLHPQYFLNGKPIDLQRAQKLVREGIVEYEGAFYLIDLKKLPSQKALDLFWSRLSNQKALNSGRASFDGNTNREIYQRHHTLDLLALRRMGIPFVGPKEWEDICRYFDALSEPKPMLRLRDNLNDVLKHYQKNGIQWLWDLYHLKLGGILADDMGLGKTIQTLGFIDTLHLHKKYHRSLIVVPVSLAYNWMAESEKFTPNLKVVVFDPAKDIHEDTDVLVCTYGLFTLHGERLAQAGFHNIFFDEAQNLKNRETERFKAAEKFSAVFKVALTGTPMENHLGNLYAILTVVAPGTLGNYAEFARDYVKPNSLPTKESLEFLRAKVRPLILRRTKDQLLTELPEKTETQIKIDFTSKQKTIYKKTAMAFSENIAQIIAKDGERKSQLQMLTALLRLRQICSDPGGVPGIKYDEVPPKLECLFEMLTEIVEEGHSVILFTQFLKTFEQIQKIAISKGLPIMSLCGADSRAARVQTLRSFNEGPDAAILLMTLKTGGVGLNLTKASYVFHIEPWWNPAVENQATDRVHRMGQSKAVSVYRLIMKESVEEKVEILKTRKGLLFDQMFGENYSSRENAESVEMSVGKDSAGGAMLTKQDFDLLLS
jgi:hypothetical protein